MSYENYSGVGKEWLKPILEIEAKDQTQNLKETPPVKKQSSRCDKTIDMFKPTEEV